MHRAVTHDGRNVAVKVQHPDVAVNMSADIRSMSAMCRVLEFLSGAGILPPTKFDAVSLMREYEKQVPLEMDFVREGRVQSLIGKNMQTNPPAALMIELEGAGMPWGSSNGGGAVVVPAVVPALSRRRVLTSELLDGRSVHAVPAPFPDANGCIMALLNALGKQIFIDGVFHSDPHPGNLLLLSTGRLALVDFGQSKELTPANMIRAASVIVAVASRNDEQILKACRAAGLRARAKTQAQVVASAYILFDTRMDIAEAKPSPALLKLGQSVWVTTFPQELFMLMRVVTILRGVIAKQGLNLSAAQASRSRSALTRRDGEGSCVLVLLVSLSDGPLSAPFCLPSPARADMAAVRAGDAQEEPAQPRGGREALEEDHRVGLERACAHAAWGRLSEGWGLVPKFWPSERGRRRRAAAPPALRCAAGGRGGSEGSGQGRGAAGTDRKSGGAPAAGGWTTGEGATVVGRRAVRGPGGVAGAMTSPRSMPAQPGASRSAGTGCNLHAFGRKDC